ncbi:hypothetical protein OV079_32020 [Nannocystis pusilla]|uniref:Uncharacterized protein n=1 Tax=Nannocystis pusilla TaxID=889268 RepID=A0A9X3ETP5_9BACT|nr:hypothetical protein [Nannocystis pusilla]MCY1010114.1 hypothetical protein [Nannocystis pusilla]
MKLADPATDAVAIGLGPAMVSLQDRDRSFVGERSSRLSLPPGLGRSSRHPWARPSPRVTSRSLVVLRARRVARIDARAGALVVHAQRLGT